MPEFSNNHYVPRFILRKFSDKISTYNFKTGELIENQKCEKVFAEQNIYPTELEKQFNTHIESNFANILNNKILKSDTICELNRKENHIVKKFLLIAQMRSLDSENYLFAEKTMMPKFFNLPIKEKIIENEGTRERWLRNLKVILECDSVKDMLNHELVTNEAFRWANIYYSGYLGIWDNTNSGEDFIITDNGMTSEQDIQYYMTGINAKKQYLYQKIQSNRNREIYNNILYAQKNFHENFLMFSISRNRMITIINPFYRLYDKQDTPYLSTPKIWPTGIINKKLYEKNRYRYVNEIKTSNVIESMDDVFIYKIQPMNLQDSVYVNKLLLDRIDAVFGFADLKKVKNSIDAYDKLGCKRVNYDGLVLKMREKGLL